MSQGTLIPDGGLAVLLRLPPSITQYTQSFTQGIFRVRFLVQLCSVQDCLQTLQCSRGLLQLAPAPVVPCEGYMTCRAATCCTATLLDGAPHIT